MNFLILLIHSKKLISQNSHFLIMHLLVLHPPCQLARKANDIVPKDLNLFCSISKYFLQFFANVVNYASEKLSL